MWSSEVLFYFLFLIYCWLSWKRQLSLFPVYCFHNQIESKRSCPVVWHSVSLWLKAAATWLVVLCGCVVPPPTVLVSSSNWFCILHKWEENRCVQFALKDAVCRLFCFVFWCIFSLNLFISLSFCLCVFLFNSNFAPKPRLVYMTVVQPRPIFAQRARSKDEWSDSSFHRTHHTAVFLPLCCVSLRSDSCSKFDKTEEQKFDSCWLYLRVLLAACASSSSIGE